MVEFIPQEVDLEKLYAGLKGRLPAYARPMFIRFVKELHMTGKYGLTVPKHW